MALYSATPVKLVSFASETGLRLHGLLYDAHGKTSVLHVHGSFGNFYDNRFITEMARVYGDHGINLLSFNNSGHDGISEGNRHGKFEYVGGSICMFESCVQDILGAIEFASSFSDRIVLQGHSLGVQRVLLFASKWGHGLPCVLLSPCDAYALQQAWLSRETVEEQLVRVRQRPQCNDQFDWAVFSEYGVRSQDWVYPIPITYPALLSLLEGPAFSTLRIDGAVPFQVNSRALVYTGGEDPIRMCEADRMFSRFEEIFPSVRKVYFASGDHMLESVAPVVADEVVAWLTE